MSKTASGEEPSPLEGPVTTDETPPEVKIDTKDKNQDKKEKENEKDKKSWKHYRGVTYHRKNNKWIAQASVNGKSKYLGTHPTREKAARVYDAFVLSTYGSSAKTNFPPSEVDFSLIPRLRSYKKKPYLGFSMLGLGMGGYVDTSKKDPKHPKHPRNAYLIFASEQRKIMKDAGLKCSGRGNMHKQFAERWKEMANIEKQKYLDLAAEDRMRYEQEMDTYEDPQAFAWMNSEPVANFPMMNLPPPATDKGMIPPSMSFNETNPGHLGFPEMYPIMPQANAMKLPVTAHPLLLKGADILPKP